MDKDLVYMKDILESAKIALKYLDNITLENFYEDTKSQDAIIRRLELVGEASSRVSEEFKGLHPEIPWKIIKSTRNFLIHEYDGIDLDIVWETVKEDIKNLIPVLQRLIKSS